jgi:hypothetical protein
VSANAAAATTLGSGFTRPWSKDATFRAEIIPDTNGRWYRLECRCTLCRRGSGVLCESILGFVRSFPYAQFELVGYGKR